MIWLYPMHRPWQIAGGKQYCYCYQHIYPDLRGGAYLADIVAGIK